MMTFDHHDGGFRLEITSIEEFALFVSIIRSDELTDETLHTLTHRLNHVAAALKAATEGAEAHGKPHS